MTVRLKKDFVCAEKCVRKMFFEIGLIIFDECREIDPQTSAAHSWHPISPGPCVETDKSKNLIPQAGMQASRTGLAVQQLQESLPNARVLYCSATGASEPRNMG